MTSVRLTTWARIGTGLAVLSLFMGALTLATLRGTEHRRRQIEALLAKSLAVRETERMRLASALHDDVGQPLYRMIHGLDTLRDGKLDSTRAAAEAERLGDLVREIDDTLRDEMRRLQASPVEEQGLATAMLELGRTDGNGPRVDVFIGTDCEEMGPPLREVVYRAAREAVVNAVKHAGASEVRVRLTRTGSGAKLEVSDDGSWKGGPEGLGLIGIRRLLEAQGGELHLRTRKGVGTTVVAVVPMAGEQA